MIRETMMAESVVDNPNGVNNNEYDPDEVEGPDLPVESTQHQAHYMGDTHIGGVINTGYNSDEVAVPVIPVKSTHHEIPYMVNTHLSGVINHAFIPTEEVDVSKIPMVTVTHEPEKTYLWSKRESAVCVRNAYKHYGSSKHPNKVLQNLNMTVSKGTIYGLLGASGCGKTTLLSCLVGRRSLNSGEIWVLGGKPGTKDSGIPGRRVGYMPQEIALFAEFSIRESMMYYGWIFGMESKEIQERLDFLLKFLDLPSQNRLVKNLSGGQQRRVSFAVALMHDPELLILDEPTVGVDPLLRQSIWNHLVQITKDCNKTVIITTHYIEEARQAHCIGLMRNGRLLAEESPSALLTTYKCQNLEDVFLMLSRNENIATEQQLQTPYNVNLAPINRKAKKVEWVYGTDEKNVVGLNFRQSKEVLKIGSDQEANKKMAYKKRERGWDSCKLTVCGKLRALLHKNFLQLLRNVGVMLIILALPIMLVIMFCLAVGRTPRNLHLAIVNKEMNWTTRECPLESPIDFFQEPLTHFSCHYLNMLRNDTIIKDYYENLDDAKEAAKLGKAWGILYFPPDFSENLYQRYSQGKSASSSIFDNSTIQVWLDMSNQQIGLLFKRELLNVFRDFSKWMIKNLNDFIILYPFVSEISHVSDKLVEIPVQQLDSVYGNSDSNFQDFVSPGVIVTIIFFLSVSLTSAALIMERSEGTQDRTWVAGVTPSEILLSQVLTQFVVMCCQTVCVLVFMFVVFGVECKGKIFWIILITILQGLNGLSFGFLISSICDTERNAIQMALGSFYAILMLSGVIWPVEGMSTAMRYTSYALPVTLATSSLRNMLSRGWSIDEPDVYWGFIASAAWIVVFLSLSFILMRNRRS